MLGKLELPPEPGEKATALQARLPNRHTHREILCRLMHGLAACQDRNMRLVSILSLP